jgi:phosphate transport system protein
MSDHIVQSFDIEFEILGRHIGEMGGVAEKMLADAMDALCAGDVDLARCVVASEARLDAMQREIEESAVVTIARRQPVALDLRECIAAIRLVGDLKRVGDRAKDIASRAVEIMGDARDFSALVGLKSMHELAALQLKDVLDAYAQRDATRARAVWFNDADLDALEDSVFRQLLILMMEDPHNISFCTHLMFCSKSLERIGDHATNIAEAIIYLVTGALMPIERPKTRIPSQTC